MHGTNTAWGEWAENLSMVMYILIPWLYSVRCMAQWSIKTFLIIFFLHCFGLWNREMAGGLGSRNWARLFRSIFRPLDGFRIFVSNWSPLNRWLSGLVGLFVATISGIMPWDIFNNINHYWWIILFWFPTLFAHYQPIKRKTYWLGYILGIASYMLRFLRWLKVKLGETGCNLDSILQMYGAWHLLTALSTLWFFRFFRRDRVKRN